MTPAASRTVLLVAYLKKMGIRRINLTIVHFGYVCLLSLDVGGGLHAEVEQVLAIQTGVELGV